MTTKQNPLDKEALLEKHEELTVKLAMLEYAGELGQELMAENAQLQQDPFYQPTSEEKNKFMAEMNKHYEARQRQQYLQNIWQKTHKVALAAGIVLLIFATTFFTVEAVRINVRNLFISAQKEFTEIRLQDQEPNGIGETPQVTWQEAYIPTAIPADFQITKVTDNRNTKVIEYKNTVGDSIFFHQIGAEVENISIQGFEGLLVNKDQHITIVWHNESHIFLLMIHAQELDNTDVLAIAESVTLQE